jgi:hypothetical protein
MEESRKISVARGKWIWPDVVGCLVVGALSQDGTFLTNLNETKKNFLGK